MLSIAILKATTIPLSVWMLSMVTLYDTIILLSDTVLVLVVVSVPTI
jgi:hypothetical protein